ncbi:MAG: hypothetical protein RJB39_137 [Candidatus Parcubacteria bacterium]|jgi:uncharacterized UPF0160 family protein
MKKIPYLSPVIAKAVDRIVKKGKVNLVTHSSNFHADDICATATLKQFFALAFPKIKITSTRSIDPKVMAAADILYDNGAVYDPKTLRFDHHQTGGAGMRENGVKYSSFGLVWKYFGVSLCALHTQATTGKLPSKKIAEHQAAIIEKKVVFHIDAMDNGQMTYEPLIDGCDVLTLDKFFEMSKIRVGGTQENIKQVNKNFDSQFQKMVKLFGQMLLTILSYAVTKEVDETLGEKMYAKAKDKRVIICDRFVYFNYSKYPEPLLVVYPDPRGGWAAKNVRLDEALYKGRFYFPESWRGKTNGELIQITGIPGARFCHNAGFMIAADTKEQVLKMIDLAFKTERI